MNSPSTVFFIAPFELAVPISKGLLYLLEAWSQVKFKQSELLLVGQTFSDMSDLLRKYAAHNVKLA